MQHSKRSQECYLLIDHRASPGTDSTLLNYGKMAPVVPEGTKVELSILTCSHCQRGVVLNPQRSHDREWCWGCNHYLCDSCGLVRKIDGQCRNMRDLFKRLQEDIFKLEARGEYDVAPASPSSPNDNVLGLT